LLFVKRENHRFSVHNEGELKEAEEKTKVYTMNICSLDHLEKLILALIRNLGIEFINYKKEKFMLK